MSAAPEVSMAQGATTAVKPVVALVGRPNVGKSTLFNRLLGRREAIIEEEPGTTRDRIYADVEWKDRSFTLVDTAGLDAQPEGELAQQVQQQARVALAEADTVLFLVDARDGVTAGDQEVADILRRTDKPVVLVANKVDNRARELSVPEFYSLGLGDPVSLSAYHGTGVADLLDRILELLPRPPAAPAVARGIPVAIVGRPNVGKSLLVNAILGQERVLVSPTPGTTRDAVDTPFSYKETAMTLIDTAGIRRSGRVETGVERYSVMRALRAVSRADIAILVLDATEGVTAQDAHIAGYVRDAYKGLVVAMNKWDLAQTKGLEREQVTRLVETNLRFLPHVQVLFVSAKLAQGIGPLLETIVKVQEERNKRVPTSAVNQCIQQAVQSHPPSTAKGRQLKILYVTQAEVAPPTFVFFVNDARLLHFSYQRFLENRLRDAFGFAGTPLRLVFKSRGEE